MVITLDAKKNLNYYSSGTRKSWLFTCIKTEGLVRYCHTGEGLKCSC